MRFIGSAQQMTSDPKVMTAIVLSLSLALPLAMYQSSKWHMQAISYGNQLERSTALKAIAARAVEHMKNWSEVRNRIPLPESDARAAAGDAAKTTQMGVSIENQRMSRVEADHVLDGLSHNTDGLFIPDAFLIRATKHGEGIFVENASEDFPDSLALTIKGEFSSKDFQ